MNENTFLRVHSFESFGTVDGPGIRFVVFLQGCHLKCKYCQNRDTWDTCSGNNFSIEEILNTILKYQAYIKPSGGVTISGGEPLLQTKALILLFEILKKYNIHTAIDTSGMVKITSNIKKLIDLTDLFLLDIKHIDSEKSKALVGFSNELELEFAKYLNHINKPVWIRQVLIPGITDNEEDLEKLKEFISTLNNVEKVELLPYHDLGRFKWQELGLEYPLYNIKTATNEDIERARKILRIKRTATSRPFNFIFFYNFLYSIVFLLQLLGFHLVHLLLL